MNKLKLSNYLFTLFLLFAIACSSQTKEEVNEDIEVPNPNVQIGTVETSEGPELCGSIAGLQCSEGQVCDFPEGQCMVADAQGICKFQPEICTKEYRPVCGCDGRTYGNDCSRLSAGVQKDYDGECKSKSTY